MPSNGIRDPIRVSSLIQGFLAGRRVKTDGWNGSALTRECRRTNEPDQATNAKARDWRWQNTRSYRFREIIHEVFTSCSARAIANPNSSISILIGRVPSRPS